MTSAIVRSLATASSTRRIERSWPIASGVTDAGKTTLSRSGRIGSIAVPSISSVGVRSSTALIRAPFTNADPNRSRDLCLSGTAIVSMPCS